MGPLQGRRRGRRYGQWMPGRLVRDARRVRAYLACTGVTVLAVYAIGSVS